MNKRKLTSERCWQNHGSLSACITRLDQIALSFTTLPTEAAEISQAVYILKGVLSSWKSNYSKAKERINELR